MAEAVARRRLKDKGVIHDWHSLTARARNRLLNQAEYWLNRQAVDCMTVTRIREQGSDGEVVQWLRTIGKLVETFR